VSTAFAVLGEPVRRRILDVVRDQPRAVGEIVALVGCSQPSASKHLKVLREAGLVAVTRDAQRRVYELRPDALRDLDAWLAPYRAQWQVP